MQIDKLKVCCAVAAALMFRGNMVSAQEDSLRTRELEGVEVVAHRRPATTRSAAPLQVLDRKGIEQLGVQDLSEAVKRFSGVTVQDYGGVGGLKTVSVRSLGAKHTAVSYDGVTITDAQSGQVDISRFSLDNIESVALSIGQADDIFQTARMYASAGALSIRTAAPTFEDKPFRAYIKMKGGSFGLFNPTLRYEQKINRRWAATAQADWMQSDGDYPFTLVNGGLVTEEKRRNSDVKNLRLEGNVYGEMGKGGSLRAKIYYYDSERGLPGSVILYSNTANERMWDNNFFVQANYENALSEQWKVRADAKYNYSFTRYMDVNDKYAAGFQKDVNTQQEYYGSAGVLYRPWQSFSVSLNTDLSRATLSNNYVDSPLPKRWTSLTALALQYKTTRLTATASLLGTYITEQVVQGERPADRKRLSPAVSLSWRPWEEQGFRVRASYQDAFRVPTFTDLYYLRIGNTNLKAEKATQYNVGMTWSGEAGLLSFLSLSADAYYNKISDKIVALPTMYIWKMMNMGEVEMKGLDVNVHGEIPLPLDMSLALTAAYSFQHAIDVTDEKDKNYRDQIPYTPRHSGSASLALENPWVNIGYSLVASGDRYALPQNIEQNRIDAYVEHTLSANRSFTIKGKVKLKVQGEIVNLTDKMYDIIQYYPMPGRSWRLSVSLQY